MRYRCALNPNCDVMTFATGFRQPADQELIDLLGAERKQRFDEYRDNMQERRQITYLRGEMPDTLRITDAQAEKLAAVLGARATQDPQRVGTTRRRLHRKKYRLRIDLLPGDGTERGATRGRSGRISAAATQARRRGPRSEAARVLQQEAAGVSRRAPARMGARSSFATCQIHRLTFRSTPCILTNPSVHAMPLKTSERKPDKGQCLERSSCPVAPNMPFHMSKVIVAPSIAALGLTASTGWLAYQLHAARAELVALRLARRPPRCIIKRAPCFQSHGGRPTPSIVQDQQTRSGSRWPTGRHPGQHACRARIIDPLPARHARGPRHASRGHGQQPHQSPERNVGRSPETGPERGRIHPPARPAGGTGHALY